MSNKMECPGCQSYTSTILQAFEDGDPCPSCGLPASAAEAVLYAQRKAADADLIARYEVMAVRVGRAEGEAARLRTFMEDIREVFERFDQSAPAVVPSRTETNRG